ncbi:hypothetical protein [Fundidesulfovibrio agrisoli]|uniref:hypothetical protein n=1 Tax=Fundidesulfovibrio agrisoli TaxID=2922717 RepID=UPI001FAD505C|nr:hypothetical protein [Fundidesulfovibrio agrisoli]
MNISECQNVRRLSGWIASALLFAALACLADGLAAGFKGEQRDLQGLPGTTLPVTAPLPQGAATISDINVQGGDDLVILTPQSEFSGFWLGGTMWRGTVLIAVDAAPGKRIFTLTGPGADPLAPAPKPLVIAVTVHANAKAMRNASPSFVMRAVGVHPFSASVAMLLLAVPFGVAGYLANRTFERILAQNGQAVVYLAKKDENGMVIAFSMGTRHGLRNGMHVPIFDGNGSQAGEALVDGCQTEDCTARMVSGECKPGYMVELPSGTRKDGNQ